MQTFEEQTSRRRTILTVLLVLIIALIAVEAIVLFGIPLARNQNDGVAFESGTGLGQHPSVLGETTERSAVGFEQQSAEALEAAVNDSAFANSVDAYMAVSCVIARDASLSRSFGLHDASDAATSGIEIAKTLAQCAQLFDEKNLESAFAASQLDRDEDGLNDFAEQVYMTNPDGNDTDGDGFSDWEEVFHGFDPLVKADG